MTLYRAPAPVRRGRLGLLLRRISTAAHQLAGDKPSPGFILHWSQKDNDLRLWAWPAYKTINQRVPPDELWEYKLTHYYRNPCCLCSYLDDSLGYTESKITLLESVNENKNDPERRPFIGEYVAECAREPSCGYFVVLERFYMCKVLLTTVYSQRAVRYNPNVFDFLKEENEEEELLRGPGTGFRRIFTPYNDDENFSRGRNELKRMREEFPDESERTLSQIDALCKEGVPASEFWKLFVQCARCGFVLPTFRYPFAHRCPKLSKTIESETEGKQDEGEELNESTERQNPELEEGSANEIGSPERQDPEPEEDSINEAGNYDYYLQFERVPLTPKDDTESEWDDTDFDDGYPTSDDELPDLSTMLAGLRSGRVSSSY